MMGDRDYRSVIQNSVESVGRELEYRFKKDVHSYMLEHQVFHVALNKYSKKTPKLTY